MSPRKRPTAAAGSGGYEAPAVVVGLDCFTGLQTARILSGHGIPVLGVVADRKHWAARTRSCAEINEAGWSGPRLLEALRELARRRPGPAVLFPCTDVSVDYLSRHRAELPEDFVLPLAPHATVQMLMDKVSFAGYAEAVGLPAPRTRTIRSRADAEALAMTLDFPCLLKPGTKSPAWLAATKAKAFTTVDPQDLLAVYDRVHAWAEELVVQEWVTGPETELYSCNAYFDGAGRPLATFVARKIRQWPPEIGTSASGEECRNDEVVDTTLRLFGDLGYHGLAYLEMKRDVRTGRLMIIEPNIGRPTGRSAIAEAGGVQLLLTAYCDALGLPLPAERVQQYGDAKWVDLRRDAQAALVARRRGELALRDWVRWLRGPKAHAIWSAQDPRPFVADLTHAARSGGTMLAGRVPRRASSRPSEGPTPRPADPAGSVLPRLSA